MKKVMAIAVAVVMLIAVFAVVGPVGASQPDGGRAVYEADIVPTGWGTDPLDEGEVYVREDGSVMVKIEGAVPDRTYYVFFGQQVGQPISAWTLTWGNPIGSFTTDGDGNGEFSLGSGSITGPVIAPVFAINHPEWELTQFATGF